MGTESLRPPSSHYYRPSTAGNESSWGEEQAGRISIHRKTLQGSAWYVVCWRKIWLDESCRSDTMMTGQDISGIMGSWPCCLFTYRMRGLEGVFNSRCYSEIPAGVWSWMSVGFRTAVLKCWLMPYHLLTLILINKYGSSACYCAVASSNMSVTDVVSSVTLG